ncbi:MAG: TraR/DksA C4-type zinc finger protein [Catalinimonas sp.]
MIQDTKERVRYSDAELSEFEACIDEKLQKARMQLTFYKDVLTRRYDSGTDNTAGSRNVLEDSDALEKESFNQMAARQQKFINQLEMALIRIKNGTYGVCIDTGKLIPRERLLAVPHTQHSIEAKLNRVG